MKRHDILLYAYRVDLTRTLNTIYVIPRLDRGIQCFCAWIPAFAGMTVTGVLNPISLILYMLCAGDSLLYLSPYT